MTSSHSPPVLEIDGEKFEFLKRNNTNESTYKNEGHNELLEILNEKTTKKLKSSKLLFRDHTSVKNKKSNLLQNQYKVLKPSKTIIPWFAGETLSATTFK